MQINNLVLLLSASLIGVFVSAERDYEERARRKLTAAQSLLKQEWECDGWSPLPPKPSGSQCLLALDRIVKQPQSCAQKYLSGAARSVYDPIYNWFGYETGVITTNVVEVAIQLSMNNGVAVEVYDAMNYLIANIDSTGSVLPLPLAPTTLSFNIARTWPLNYPTFVRNEESGFASITQNVWSVQGQLLTVVISKAISLLPVVC